MSRRLFILGSTGSIGCSAIEVVQHLRQVAGKGSWPVVGLAAGENTTLLEEQAELINCEAISAKVSYASKAKHVYCGKNSAVEMICNHAKRGDLVVAAIVGFSGIAPVLAAIDCGCDIALANKECLVAGGELVMASAKEAGVRILPIDSEHSAIFQCIENSPSRDISRIVITASGGSLRDMTNDEMESASVEEVLSHPTWEMGKKVTVDSASLMNKALELIEARWLFNMDSEMLDAVIHPQSIVHGFVEFTDGSVVAQMAKPDMRLPIQYAITWPDRTIACGHSINWNELGNLEFEPIDRDRYPAIPLAHHIIRVGGTAGAVLNAANEVVVEAFLEQRLPFGSMIAIVKSVVDKSKIINLSDYTVLEAADSDARSLARDLVAEASVSL